MGDGLNYFKFYFKWYVLLLIIISVPIVVTDVLPLYDYPNHIARLHILHLNGADPFINQYYTINWQFLPNLALELVTYPLVGLIGAESSGRVFLILTFVVISSGAFFLNYSLVKQFNVWPFLVFLFMYNKFFLFGFMSYNFSIGVFLWGFGLWIYFRDRNAILRLACFSIFTLVLLTMHLVGFGLFGLAIGGYELSRYIWKCKSNRCLPDANFWVGALQFLPAIIIFFTLSPTGDNPKNIDFELSLWTLKMRTIEIFDNLIVFYGSSLGPNLTFFIIPVLLILYFKKIIRTDNHILLPLIFMGMIYMFFPTGFLGTSWLNERLPIAVIFIISSIIITRKINLVTSKRILIGLTLFLGFYSSFLVWKWDKFDDEYNDVDVLLELIEDGSKLQTIIIYDHIDEQIFYPPILHHDSLSVIDKSIFDSNLFAFKNQQPINVTEKMKPYTFTAFRSLISVVSFNKYKDEWYKKYPGSMLLPEYDYILTYQYSLLPKNEIPVKMAHIKSQGDFDLYKVIK